MPRFSKQAKHLTYQFTNDKIITGVMNSQTLEQLQEELQQAIDESMKISNIGNVLTKYNINDNVLKVQYILDVNQLQSHDGDDSQQGEGLLPQVEKPPIKLKDCTWQWCQVCSPTGSWICG